MLDSCGRRLRAVLALVLAVSAPAVVRGEAVPEQVIELPSPELLAPGESELDLHLLARRTGSGVFSNLARATSASEEARWRWGLSSGCELALAASLNEQTATPVSTALSDASAGMPVLGGALKFRLPDRLFGWRVLFGTGASLINGRDRERFLPDDYARFNPSFVEVSRMIRDDVRAELVFKRNRVFANDRSDGTNFTTFDAALEWFAGERLSFQVEVLSQRLSMRTIGDFGTSENTDGVSANAAVRVETGPSTAVQLYGRGLNRPEDREVGLWWGCRL